MDRCDCCGRLIEEYEAALYDEPNGKPICSECARAETHSKTVAAAIEKAGRGIERVLREGLALVSYSVLMHAVQDEEHDDLCGALKAFRDGGQSEVGTDDAK